MLYLHCGWPRTGTSSIQAALFEHRDALAGAGLVYPEQWRVSTTSPTHHGLYEPLSAALESEGAFDDFRAFLTAHDDSDVLLSAESLTDWLVSRRRQGVLLEFLAAAQEVTSTRCIWTLRSFDDLWHSLYLLALRKGMELPVPAEYIDQRSHPNNPFDVQRLNDLFGGMSRVEEAADDVVYVRYDAGGAHNAELLSAFRIPARAGAAILERLESGPRLNTGLSHKQAIVLLNLESLSARAGVGLDRSVLRAAFADGRLEFEEDWPCELLGDELRSDMRERALAAARRSGFMPYLEFFEAVEVGGSDPEALTPDVITDHDLRRLMAYLRSRG